MPTYNRRVFVPRAVRYFLRQDYPERELIVVDDGTDPVEDLIPADPRISYVRLGKRQTIGAKSNIACEKASGEIIARWDDDDWIAPWRLSYQVGALLDQDVDVVGLRTLAYLDLSTGQAWRYEYPRNRRAWVATPTFCFRREFALAKPFPDSFVGSGTHWLWSAPAPRIGTLTDFTFYVGMIHPGNIAVKDTANDWWKPRPPREVAAMLGDDWPSFSC